LPLTRRDVVLVTGATGRVGRHVVDELLRAGASVRALTRRRENAMLPAGVEVVTGQLRLEELSPDEFRQETASTWPAAVTEMLLGAWQATLGRPALVTSSVQEIMGSPARTFYRWAADNASAFAAPSQF
jgi:nucleoside-diphosphate-sugar epimerase